MIVFLNGPFGVGKSTVARLLVDRIPGAVLFDPEPVGALLRGLLGPVEQVDDFQEYAIWRGLVVDLARRLIETYGRPLVIPMTVWRRDYVEEISAGLRQFAPDLHLIVLTAPREVLVERILGRPDADGPHTWCLGHLDVGLATAGDLVFGVPVQTDGRSPAEIADAILALIEESGGGSVG